MGQKVNAITFRSSLKNSKWSFKYTNQNNEEASIFLYKNIEIVNYINKIFKNFNFFIKNCKIEHTPSTVNILIFFYQFKSSTNKKNIKQLISTIITNILTLSTNLYTKNKVTVIKTQDLSKKFENKINSNSEYLTEYKNLLRSFKKFLKDPLQKNLIKMLFITISEKDSAKLLSEAIGFYITKNKKKHNYLLFLLKKIINSIINTKFSKTKGIKIIITGRLNGAPRAKKKI